MPCPTTINDFVKVISNTLDAYTTVFFVPDREKNILTISCLCSLSKHINIKTKINSGEGIIGWVYREQLPIIINNFENNSTALKFYTVNEGIKSFVAIPLPLKSGVLCLDSKKSYSFTEKNEKIFNQMGQIISSIYKREMEFNTISLYKNFYFLSREIDDILVSSNFKIIVYKFIVSVYKIMNIKTSFFVIPNMNIINYFIDEENNAIKPIEIDKNFYSDQSLIGWVINNRKTLFLGNITKARKAFILNKNFYTDKFNNFLGIPIKNINSQDIVGAICFIKHDCFCWEEIEISFIEILYNRINNFLFKNNLI